jgi:hypothetical protein
VERLVVKDEEEMTMSAPNAALQLVPRTSVLPSANDWSTMMAMAETLYRSGVLPEHIKNPAAVVAIVQKGPARSITSAPGTKAPTHSRSTMHARQDW